MGWKRGILETVVWGASVFAPKSRCPDSPRRIFVLRNNDIGDLLIVTPLFAALKQRYPTAQIVAGIGEWNRPILERNPSVDVILPMPAPWHNQQVKPQGLGASLDYLWNHPSVEELRQMQCEIGLDVLGSPFGSMLMMKAGIPYRVGVRGYAGGHTAASVAVPYDPCRHVGAQALEMARLVGCEALPENRPQLFLPRPVGTSGRVVLAPGGGYEAKRWPLANYVGLANCLRDVPLTIVGGEQDAALGKAIAEQHPEAQNLAGALSLTETFHAIASAAAVVCNSSMAMHVAAAFRKPCITVLGEIYPSASAHAAQWGYPETIILGKEQGRACIATVEEVAHALREQL